MSATKKAYGEIRQSQLVTTFGPGSMVDLPNYSVLISGLEFGRLEVRRFRNRGSLVARSCAGD